MPTFWIAARYAASISWNFQRSGPTALLRKDVADKLGLSETQRKTLLEIQQKSMEERRAAMEGKDRQNMTDEDRQKMASMQKITSEKMIAVLTPGQMKEWKALQGEPFHFPAPQRG